LARRVEAKRYHFDPLEAHHPIGFGPAAIVADQHANDAVEGAPNGKAEIAWFEILLFKMLKRQMRPVVRMARQMDLSIFAENLAVRPHDNGCVVAPAVADGFGIAEIEADAAFGRRFKQRAGVGIRHLVFEKPVGLISALIPVAREKRGQRQFGEDDEAASQTVRLLQHGNQALHHGRSIIGEMNGTELGRGDFQTTGHRVLLSR